MYISWLGYSCFKIQEKDLNFIIDPYDQKIDNHPPIIKKAEVIMLTDQTLAEYKKYKDIFVITCPGEYEIKGVYIQGIQAGKDKTMYFMEIDGVTMAHLGNTKDDLTSEQQELIEDVDVLMIPVGGNNGYDYKKASLMIQNIEPRIVLPMSYKTPGLKIKVDHIDLFMKEEGLKITENLDKVKITKKDMPSDEMLFYILKKQ